ncbi:MAG: cation:proton antiporter [Gammaproteobacteria bacterium]|nr:cation:proton antiporter [Gammaproteobacteria bacterium]MBT8152033.1 cation:proton antiporter [Gammaproteobacteria bacterium]NND39625.1 cation:proton antiporter [Pseudomonadales bacterium]NNM11865.1 cation:proton antiporter [Pseudomonadales bacterium]RZV51888.1 MAG: cation:proton antiporter [Pseudomonadales bacterium]
MDFTAQLLLSIGGIFLVGQAISALGRRTFLPRVTLLLLFGIAIGKHGLDIIPVFFYQYFELIAETTLMMVGFLIGGKLTKSTFNLGVKNILGVSIAAAVCTTAIVTAGLWWIGMPLSLCIIMGCIAAATDAAATLDSVIETKSKSRFSRFLIAIVALDDVWALVLFGFGMSLALSLNGHMSGESPLPIALIDIAGAITLGLFLGFPASYFTGRVKKGEPILTEALGMVFVCGGLAIYLEVSFLIASIVMGAVVSNFARHHEYAFHEIENIEWPFMVIFFVLAGATLDLQMLGAVGFVGLMFILFRIAGKYLGAWLGSRLVNAESEVRNWMGIAMLPQAGVAIGMALVASSQFPEYKQVLLPLVIGTTVFFELVGPIFTRLALVKSSG